MKQFKLAKRGRNAELYIYDHIGEDYFGGVSSKAVKQALNDLGAVDTLTIRVNSEGGSLFEGYAMYQHIRNANAKNRVTEIDALAASAASVVALAGDEVRIAENAWVMIHNPMMIIAGDHRELAAGYDLALALTKQVAELYAKHLNHDAAEMRDVMDAETWWDAQQTIDAGFAQSISEPMQVAAKLDPSRFKHPPQALLKRADIDVVSGRLAAMSRRAKALGVDIGSKRN